MNKPLLLCLFVSLTGAITQDQLNAFQDLVQLPAGVYATCNIVFDSKIVRFNKAEENCKEFNLGTAGTQEGNLVTIDTAEKNEMLSMLLNLAYPEEELDANKWIAERWAWSGLRKTKNNRKKMKKGKYRREDWEWTDGSSPKDFENWLDKQPDQRQVCDTDKPKCYQNQMRVNHKGEWDDTFRFKKHPYACDYQGKYIISSELKSWDNAKEACVNAGLQLAKIRSDDELEEIMTAANYFMDPIDESKKFGPNNWFWLGGNDIETEGTWVWVDGEEIKWTIPWDKKAGNDNSKKQNVNGQDVLSISRLKFANKQGGITYVADDSYQNDDVLKAFACQCPGT